MPQFSGNPYHYVRLMASPAPQNAMVWDPPGDVPQAFVANAAMPSQQSTSWIVDTGASHQMAVSPQNRAPITPLSGTEHAFLGNGQGLTIKFIGSSSFSSPMSPSTQL